MLYAQQAVVNNKHFSIGSYGRVGIARGDDMLYPRSLNLNGMGSIGGRMEENDYFELAVGLHFTQSALHLIQRKLISNPVLHYIPRKVRSLEM